MYLTWLVGGVVTRTGTPKSPNVISVSVVRAVFPVACFPFLGGDRDQTADPSLLVHVHRPGHELLPVIQARGERVLDAGPARAGDGSGSVYRRARKSHHHGDFRWADRPV